MIKLLHLLALTHSFRNSWEILTANHAKSARLQDDFHQISYDDFPLFMHEPKVISLLYASRKFCSMRLWDYFCEFDNYTHPRLFPPIIWGTWFCLLKGRTAIKTIYFYDVISTSFHPQYDEMASWLLLSWRICFFIIWVFRSGLPEFWCALQIIEPSVCEVI